MKKKSLFQRKHIEECFYMFWMSFSFLLLIGILIFILITVISKGLPALDIAMLTQTPKGGFYLGKEGGILNAILGSLYLAGGATILSIIISLPLALYLGSYIQNTKWADVVRLSLDVLWGIPSIVYGAFGFTIMLFFGLRASLLGGIIVLTLLEIPIMCRAMEEVVRLMPEELSHASLALGANRMETATKVVARQALPGLMTAILLAFGRAIGDAASVLFTAGFSDQIPNSIFRPAASLPLAIFFQLGTPFPEVQERAYASALVLTVIVLTISFGSRWLAQRLSRFSIK